MSISEPVTRVNWVSVVTGVPRASDPPIRRRRVFAQVIIGGIVVILVVVFVGIVAARRLAEAEAVNDAAKTANLIGESVVQPVVTDGLLAGDPAALAAIGQVVRDHVVNSSGSPIVRVKIWTPQGLIVYSDEPRLIGHTFALGADERAVLSNPKIRADVSNLQDDENIYERDSGKLLQVYRPVWTQSGKPLLFETYFKYDEVTARSSELWRGFAGVTLSSILLLVVLLLPILWRLLDRLKRSQQQREALLRKAVDASTEERRRIAGTLHDGVVQDLVATSFAVAGYAERAAAQGRTALADELRAAAGTVRTSIGSLRSLLVDIYPPSLASAGLAAALQDLGASLRSRGIDVTLDLTADSGLDDDGDRLVYRVAQECLNNIAKHAAACHVTVRLACTETHTVLDIHDDGVGFDVQQVLARPADGHFGLRVLGDVAAEASADLQLASAPGAGTRWQLRVPRA